MTATRSDYQEAIIDLEKAINFSERSGSSIVTFDVRKLRLIYEVHTKKAYVMQSEPGGIYVK